MELVFATTTGTLVGCLVGAELMQRRRLQKLLSDPVLPLQSAIERVFTQAESSLRLLVVRVEDLESSHEPLKFRKPLGLGTYRLQVKYGEEGNSIKSRTDSIEVTEVIPQAWEHRQSIVPVSSTLVFPWCSDVRGVLRLRLIKLRGLREEVVAWGEADLPPFVPDQLVGESVKEEVVMFDSKRRTNHQRLPVANVSIVVEYVQIPVAELRRLQQSSMIMPAAFSATVEGVARNLAAPRLVVGHLVEIDDEIPLQHAPRGSTSDTSTDFDMLTDSSSGFDEASEVIVGVVPSLVVQTRAPRDASRPRHI